MPVLKRADILVILCCLGGVAVLLLSFYQDLNRSLSRQSDKPVGIIVIKRNTAQRRFVDRVLWDRLQKSSSVYNGDYIRTAEHSEATLFLDEVGNFDITENTLLQISFDKNNANISLSQGSLSVNTLNEGSVCTILVGDSTATIGSGAVAVLQTANDNGIMVRLMEGTVSVIAKGGRQHNLEAGDILSLSSDGSMEESARLGVLAPKPVIRMIRDSEEPTPILFSFRRFDFEEGQHIKLEIASNRRFTSSRVYDIKGDTFTAELIPGNYWWRAYPSNSPLHKASSGSITITYCGPPILINPLTNAQLNQKGAAVDVLFRWTASEDASAYIIEIANNPAMQNPFMVKMVENPFFLARDLKESRWYWRVQPVFANVFTGEPALSPIGAFSTGNAEPFMSQKAQARQDEIAPDKPVEFSVEPSALAASKPAAPEPLISAEKQGSPQLIPKAAPAPTPVSPLSSPPAASSSSSPSAPPPFQPVDPPSSPVSSAEWEHIPGPFTEDEPDTPKAPPVFASPSLRQPPDNYTVTKQQINRSLILSWRAVKKADLYLFTLYRENADGALTSMRNMMLRETSYSLTDLKRFESGSYIWTVEAIKLDNNGRVHERSPAGGRRFIVPTG